MLMFPIPTRNGIQRACHNNKSICTQNVRYKHRLNKKCYPIHRHLQTMLWKSSPDLFMGWMMIFLRLTSSLDLLILFWNNSTLFVGWVFSLRFLCVLPILASVDTLLTMDFSAQAAVAAAYLMFAEDQLIIICVSSYLGSAPLLIIRPVGCLQMLERPHGV